MDQKMMEVLDNLTVVHMAIARAMQHLIVSSVHDRVTVINLLNRAAVLCLDTIEKLKS